MPCCTPYSGGQSGRRLRNCFNACIMIMDASLLPHTGVHPASQEEVDKDYVFRTHRYGGNDTKSLPTAVMVFQYWRPVYDAARRLHDGSTTAPSLRQGSSGFSIGPQRRQPLLEPKVPWFLLAVEGVSMWIAILIVGARPRTRFFQLLS
jgi:hypothetical protein